MSWKQLVKTAIRAGTTPWITENRIIRDVRKLGVEDGALMLVHSAMSSLGFVVGGEQTVIRALLRVVGHQGTLVMPAHSWERSGNGDFSFDLQRTPSCVGAITEAFRRYPGVTRSLHPTHSVCALGPLAATLVQGHEHASTPCGVGTPYAGLIANDGKILFLGATLAQNTMYHTLEAMCESEYLMQPTPETFEITDRDGRSSAMQFRRHVRGPDRRFADTEKDLTEAGILTGGKVGACRSLLLDCRGMADFVQRKLHDDPRYLLQSAAASASGHTEATLG